MSYAYRFACSLYGKYTLGSEPGEMMLNLGSNTLMPCGRGGGGAGGRQRGESFFYQPAMLRHEEEEANNTATEDSPPRPCTAPEV